MTVPSKISPHLVLNETLSEKDLAKSRLCIAAMGASPQQTADPQLCLHSGPFQNLEIFDCLMSLPPEWGWRIIWIDRLLATRCPRLTAWPFNRHRETWRHALALSTAHAPVARGLEAA